MQSSILIYSILVFMLSLNFLIFLKQLKSNKTVEGSSYQKILEFIRLIHYTFFYVLIVVIPLILMFTQVKLYWLSLLTILIYKVLKEIVTFKYDTSSKKPEYLPLVVKIVGLICIVGIFTMFPSMMSKIQGI